MICYDVMAGDLWKMGKIFFCKLSFERAHTCLKIVEYSGLMEVCMYTYVCQCYPVILSEI